MQKLWLQFHFYISHLTDKVDYKYTSQISDQITVIIPAGHASVPFDLTILDDIIIEDTESFELSIIDVSLPHNVSVGYIESATVNIIDNECEYCYLFIIS